MQGFKEWAAETGDAQGDGEYDPVFKHVESVATHLSNLEKQVSCPWDPTLEADLLLLKGQKYLIAANFRNNEDLLPHLIVQLWHLLAILPQGSAFVSVYESGSTDSTGMIARHAYHRSQTYALLQAVLLCTRNVSL